MLASGENMHGDDIDLFEDVCERDIIWDGVSRAESLSEDAKRLRLTLADAAKSFDWGKVLAILVQFPDLVNSSRPGGTALYAPLHQAAQGGADMDVVQALLGLGAFRSLRNAVGERPVDIARKHARGQLATLLLPVHEQRVPERLLSRLEEHFHSVVRERADNLVREHRLRLPSLEPMLEFGRRKWWFAVPGMYGGFAYWLARVNNEATLVTESWCRVERGSGQRHVITEQGIALVEEGFV
jgi:hypothetical protein